MLSSRTRRGIVVLFMAVAVVIAFYVDPVPQDPRYHQFADRRTVMGIGNFFNIVSNLPFPVIGFLGLLRYPRLSHPETRAPYAVLCLGCMLVGTGSAYYHAAPDNETLLWDRLPMTLVLMALLSLVLDERVLRTPSLMLLWPCLVLGMGTTLYWSWTESVGQGDLRPYALVQFLPVMLVPLVLALFPQKYLSSRLLASAFALYALAKICEHADAAVLAMSGLTGGHALKHILAAAAVLALIHAVPVRNLLHAPEPEPGLD